MLRSNFFKVAMLICAMPYLLSANDFSVRKVKNMDNSYAVPAIVDSANIYIGCYNANSISVINKVTDAVTTQTSPGYLYHLGLKGNQLILFSVNQQMNGFMVSGSTDYGKTWEEQPTNHLYSAYSCIIKNNDSALFFGGDVNDYGSVLATYNNSKSFTIVFDNLAMFSHSVNPKDNIIYFADYDGNLFRSNDFCKTNTADTTITAEKNGRINSLQYVNSKLFVVYASKIFTCDELTADWRKIEVPDAGNYSFASMKSDTSGNYYLVMTNYSEGRILKSRDLVEWSVWFDVPSAINDIFYFTDNKFAITGLQGDVWIAEPIGAGIASGHDANWTVTKNGNNWYINFNDDKDHSLDEITIVDINGKELPTITVSNSRNSVEISTANTIMSGAYLINVRGAGYKTSKKIIVNE